MVSTPNSIFTQHTATNFGPAQMTGAHGNAPSIVSPAAAEIKAVEDSRSVFSPPESAYLGLGKTFAEYYDLRSEPPKEFFYLEFLVQLGGHA